jgi:acyl carrier protein
MENNQLSGQQIQDMLIAFIRDQFLSGDEAAELDADTPLLEWGILSSLKIATLLIFLRKEMGADIPLEMMSGKNFRNVRSISALVCDLVLD